MPFLGLRLGNETQLSVADIQYLGALAEEHGYGEVAVDQMRSPIRSIRTVA